MVRRDAKLDEEKAMICGLERQIWLHVKYEILAPKEEPQNDMEQPHAEEQRVEALTDADTPRDGKNQLERLTD